MVRVIIKHRSPIMALLWSLAIPGFGQLYNKDYLVGLLLVFLEFIINVKANLNMAIIASFRGQYQQSAQVADCQWLLFYPCVYAFSLWHAYNRSIEINTNLDKKDVSQCLTFLNGPLIGMAMVGTLGIIYSQWGPIFGGMLGMIAGFAAGWLIDVASDKTS